MPRVLLVEDSATQAHLMSRLLSKAGFDVCAVASSEEGFVRLTQEPFDIVLTDLLMPGETGFDLCRRIKADPAQRHVPVVVLTSQGDPVNVLRGLEAGADGFMTKGRLPAEIIGGIRRTLERFADGSALSPRPQPLNLAKADSGGGRGAGAEGDTERVQFLDCEFALSAGKKQLLNVLLSAFEDVVHVNQQLHKNEEELRKTNAHLQEMNFQVQKANVELQKTLRLKHEALQQLQATQNQLVQAEKLSALGQMFAAVGHEIKNSLAALSSNILVFQRDTHTLAQTLALYRQADRTLAGHDPALLARIQELAEQGDLLDTLASLECLLAGSRDELERIESTVNDLREFARIEKSALESVDLNPGIEATINKLRGQAQKRQVDIVLELTPLPLVACSPTQIHQVVLNLVSNALDACAPGGKVTVRTATARDAVEVHVLDNGCGIDPAIRDRIFEPFFTTKRPGKDTGISLSISYGIVQDHGGRLTFDSVPGQGSHFVLWLPLRQS